MVLFGYLLRHDLLIDPLDEGNGGDIGDRIGLADQPARRFQRLFHAIEQLMGQLVPSRLALLLGIGLSGNAEPRLLALLGMLFSFAASSSSDHFSATFCKWWRQLKTM